MRRLTVLLLICFITTVTGSGFRSRQQVPDGKKLFHTQCASCHHPTKALTGPPFQHIREYYTFAELTRFIHNPPKFIYSDKRMLLTFHYYANSVMSAFPFLKETELKAILDYVDEIPYDSTSAAYAHRRLTAAEKNRLLRSNPPKSTITVTIEKEDE